MVHFTNSGSEAVDLALTMAREYTGNLDVLALRTAYHGPTAAAQSVTGIAGWRHPGMPQGKRMKSLYKKIMELTRLIRAINVGNL